MKLLFLNLHFKMGNTEINVNPLLIIQPIPITVSKQDLKDAITSLTVSCWN